MPRVYLTLTGELATALDKASRDRGQTKSTLVSLALTEYLTPATQCDTTEREMVTSVADVDTPENRVVTSVTPVGTSVANVGTSVADVDTRVPTSATDVNTRNVGTSATLVPTSATLVATKPNGLGSGPLVTNGANKSDKREKRKERREKDKKTWPKRVDASGAKLSIPLLASARALSLSSDGSASLPFRPDTAGQSSMALVVVGAMNRRAGKRWRPEAWVRPIGRLIALGYTQDDMLAVVEYHGKNCESSGDWRWYKPDTLLRVRNFTVSLENARAGHTFGGGVDNGEKGDGYYDE